MTSIHEPEVIVHNGKQLLDLNNDCLSTILRCLPLEDLCSIALTCTRLHNISQQVFLINPANKRIDVLSLLRLFDSNSLKKTERFFQCFGNLLVEITLDLTNFDNIPIVEHWSMRQPIFHLITKHCSDGTLKSLRVHGLIMKSPHAVEMMRLFSSLITIRLESCDEVTKVLSESKECKNLTLTGWSWKKSTFNLHHFHFPKLESFVLRYIYVFAGKYNSDCVDFLRRHNKLKVLKLHIAEEYDFNLNVVGELKELEVLKLCHVRDDDYNFNEFSMKSRPTSLRTMCDLKHLKTLVIHGYEITDIIPFMLGSAAIESLQYLALSQMTADKDFCEGLSRFKSLRVLKLTKCDGLFDDHIRRLNSGGITDVILEHPFGFTVDGFVGIAEGFLELESITLYDTDKEIGADIYDKLIARLLGQNRRLSITFCETFHEEPAINSNSNVVQIIIKDRESFIYRKPKKRLYAYTYIK